MHFFSVQNELILRKLGNNLKFSFSSTFNTFCSDMVTLNAFNINADVLLSFTVV